MTNAQNPLMPGSPADFEVPEPELTIEDVEPARELGNEAREQLQELGFSDTQIDDWADEFIAHTGEGSVGELIDWIAAQQNAASGG